MKQAILLRKFPFYINIGGPIELPKYKIEWTVGTDRDHMRVVSDWIWHPALRYLSVGVSIDLYRIPPRNRHEYETS